MPSNRAVSSIKQILSLDQNTGVVRSTLASVSNLIDSAYVSARSGRGGGTVYNTINDLPLSGNTAGDQAFVDSSNLLYIYSGEGWYNIALINTSPSITSGGAGTYTLATDGTPTVITLIASDPEGIPITWSYAVTSGSLGSTATVSQADNVFTITPSTNSADAGTFSITFTASDGVNIATDVNSFTLEFIPDWSLLYTLDNPNAYDTSANDFFGEHVAISGNYAIVGAYAEDDAGGSGNGKAYIFNVTTGALVHTLDNPNAYAGAGDLFGHTVAISGNYAIVGAYGEDDAGGGNSGKAYIFNVTTGALLHTLDNPNPGSNYQFGQGVEISGNYAIVGAPRTGDAGGTQSGKAYIFNVTTGALLYTLDNPNAYSTSASDFFGESVGVSGDYAIAGAHSEGDTAGSRSGKAYIFNATTGSLVHTLNNPNPYGVGTDDFFGRVVAISGNYAIVGAYQEDDAGGTNSGKAYIFNVTTGALIHTLDNPNAYDTSLDDLFGYSVAISGNYAIVGARSEDDSGGTTSGKAYIFDVTTGDLIDTLDNPNAYDTSANDYFGFSVAIDGDYVVVGAYGEDDAGGTNSGKAYIFKK